jgi:Holliday junction resolvase-like predicted endonuclease
MIRVFTSTTQQRGELAELFAVTHVKTLGHNVFARNISTKYGEIDIITIKDSVLYIWEVKSYTCNNIEDLSSSNDLHMFEQFTRKKIKNMMRTYGKLSRENYFDAVNYQSVCLYGALTCFIRNISQEAPHSVIIIPDINI